MFHSPSVGAGSAKRICVNIPRIERFLKTNPYKVDFKRYQSSSSAEFPGSSEKKDDRIESKTDEVKEALQKVQEAIAEVELTVERIDRLPSARIPTSIDKVKDMLRPVAKVFLLVTYCVGMHSWNVGTKLIGGLVLAALVAQRGYRNSSLSASGAIAAVAVGWATLSSSFRAGLILLGFFFASSALTKFGDENKDIEEDHKKGGQRNWIQVLSNGGIPAMLAVAGCLLSSGIDLSVLPYSNPPYSIVTTAFLGYFSCCCGDTWSSEIGQLSEEEPRLITTLRPVRKGTNGGCTLLGLASSCFGGLYIGLIFFITGAISPGSPFVDALSQWKIIPLGIAAGLVGSLIDSVLGATIQFTGYNRDTGKITGKNGPSVSRISGVSILDNNGVNVLSASLTAILTALCAAFL